MKEINYKIIGKCPFGTGKVNEDGQMDQSQFSANGADDYIDGTGANLAIIVAQQYGGKPVCQIKTDLFTIDVYALSDYYGVTAKSIDGWYSVFNTLWINTVNPVCIAKHVHANFGKSK